MRIEQIIGSAFWVSLLVCAGILIAALDDVPELPAFRQATITARVSHSISRQPQVSEVRDATLRKQDETSTCSARSVIDRPLTAPVMELEFTRHRSDSSPPRSAAV